MRAASTTSIGIVRANREIRAQKHLEVVRNGEVSNEVQSNLSSRENMAKNPISPEYATALQALTDRITKQQTKRLDKENSPDLIAVQAFVETGRKLDKVYLHMIKKGANKPIGKMDLRYFIERATGKVYGVKSPVAPNLNRYFGTIYNASKWDWSEFYAKNVSDDSVVPLDRQYDGVVFYRDKDEVATEELVEA